MCDMEYNAQVDRIQILEDADVLMKYITSRTYSVWQQSDLLYKFSKIGQDFFRRLKLITKFVDEMIATKKKIITEKKEGMINIFTKCLAVHSNLSLT